jgi:hypothetical protein
MNKEETMILSKTAMSETKNEIETALANGGQLSFGALMNAYFAVRYFIDTRGDVGVQVGIDLSEEENNRHDS